MTFTMPYPPSVNAYWLSVRGRVVLSAHAKRYKATAALAAKAAGVRPMTGPVSVEMHAYRPRKTGDLDNTLKAVFDALNGVAWIDDSQVISIEAHRYDNKKHPCVDVTVEAAPPEVASLPAPGGPPVPIATIPQSDIDRWAHLEAENATIRERNHDAAHIIIDCIGAPGPEGIDETARRAVSEIASLRARLVEVERERDEAATALLIIQAHRCPTVCKHETVGADAIVEACAKMADDTAASWSSVLNRGASESPHSGRFEGRQQGAESLAFAIRALKGRFVTPTAPTEAELTDAEAQHVGARIQNTDLYGGAGQTDWGHAAARAINEVLASRTPPRGKQP